MDNANRCGTKWKTKIAGDKILLRVIATEIVLIQFHCFTCLFPFLCLSHPPLPRAYSFLSSFTSQILILSMSNWKRQKNQNLQTIFRKKCNFYDEISWLWKHFTRMLMSIAFKCVCYFSKWYKQEMRFSFEMFCLYWIFKAYNSKKAEQHQKERVQVRDRIENIRRMWSNKLWIRI